MARVLISRENRRKSRVEQNQKAWHHIEELFKVREHLKKDRAEGNSHWHNLKIQEIEYVVYKALYSEVNAIVCGILHNNLPADIITEIAHEAIYKLFNAYSNFRGKASLKVYFVSIVKNLVLDYLKKINKERNLFVYADEDLINTTTNEIALQEFNEKEKAKWQEDPVPNFADSIFELIDTKEQKLTDKEFVAVIIKLAATQMKKKPTDEELARKLGMKRTTFLDVFKRGIDKICLYWKAKVEK